MPIEHYFVVALPFAVGCGLSFAIVRHLLVRAMPELAPFPRRTRNAILSALSKVDVEVPTRVVALRGLVFYGSVLGVYVFWVATDTPPWVFGLLCGVTAVVVRVIRFELAKSYLVQALRNELAKLDTKERLSDD